jgi:hypothetical protein
VQVYPQDLGLRRHIALIRRRAPLFSGNAVARPSEAGAVSESLPPRRGLLGRFWAQGSGLEPEQAAAALPVLADAPRKDSTLGIAQSAAKCFAFLFGLMALLTSSAGPVSGAFLALVATSVALCLLVYPRLVFRRLHQQPLTAEEIEALLPEVRDGLERAYLGLVLDTIGQKLPTDAGRDVRRALQALGEALDRLPPVPAGFRDTDALRQSALAVLGEARAETDPVARASLLRHSEALERHAHSGDRFNLLARRLSALRRELMAQVEALRSDLSAFGLDVAPDAHVAHLAEAVRRVAREAAAVATANDEFDALIEPARAARGDAPARLRVGQGGGSA